MFPRKGRGAGPGSEGTRERGKSQERLCKGLDTVAKEKKDEKKNAVIMLVI